MDAVGEGRFVFHSIIDSIDQMNWESLTSDDVMRTAKAYYYFSIQFRENLAIACQLYPNDTKLQELWDGECDTANLSPWPGIAKVGEKMNHDEFMRRLLGFHPIGADAAIGRAGARYLIGVRAVMPEVRAMSI